MNKPVAWMAYTYMKDNLVGNVKVPQLHLTQPPPNHYDEIIPLYTHPVNPKYDPETGEPLIDGYPLFSGLPHPVKELTDFEIKGVLGLDECWVGEDCSIPDMIAFAKAILRKAQEK